MLQQRNLMGPSWIHQLNGCRRFVAFLALLPCNYRLSSSEMVRKSALIARVYRSHTKLTVDSAAAAPGSRAGRR